MIIQVSSNFSFFISISQFYIFYPTLRMKGLSLYYFYVWNTLPCYLALICFVIHCILNNCNNICAPQSTVSLISTKNQHLAALNSRSLWCTDSLTTLTDLISWKLRDEYSTHDKKLWPVRGLDSRPWVKRWSNIYFASTCCFGSWYLYTIDIVMGSSKLLPYQTYWNL